MFLSFPLLVLLVFLEGITPSSKHYLIETEDGGKQRDFCLGGACLPSGRGCFGPRNVVETKEGLKTIPELRLGDEIRTSGEDFTEFLGWIDRQSSVSTEMLELFTTDTTVTLTPSHVVFSSNTTMYAGDLVPGDTLLHWSEGEMEEKLISKIRTRKEAGVWSPLTRAGTLLVNGFLMSCYSSFPHEISDIAMAPIKAMSTTLLDDEESQNKDGLRKVVGLIKQFGQVIGVRRREKITEECIISERNWTNTLSKKFPTNDARVVDSIWMKSEF